MSVKTATTTATEQNGASAAPPSNYRLPSDVTLQHASKLAIVEDKPIMLDYWTASYTSPIAKFYKSVTEYIIITENSIYIVSSDIPTKKIS